MEFMPHVGWANAIPDSNGRASFVINGHKWRFKGYGYHDKVCDFYYIFRLL